MALVPAAEFARVKESARRFAAGFTPGQKAVTIAAVLGALVIGIVFMLLSGKPTYAPLFTNLSAQDAGAITQKLTADHVPYQLQDGGSTILVPQNDVDQERLASAEAGLPTQSTVGLTLLDKEGLTTSQLTQQADYLQAIQGELEQTIDAIGGVSSSQVNVALPANQTFALNNSNPTGASVLVSLQPGHTLSSGEVQAIVHLVSSSVPGLSASNVTVADSDGTLLAGPGVTQSSAGQASAFDAQQEAKVAAYLATIFGTGNADVQVNATLNMNKVHTNTQSVVPGANGGAPVGYCTSTKQSNTKYTGTGTPTGGAAGTATAPIAGGNGTYTQTSTTKNCETSTQTQTVTQAPGSVTQQSVAVLVNAKAMPKGTSLAQIRAGVAAAVNLQTTRGDVLSLTAVKFNTTAATAATASAQATAAANAHNRMVAVIKAGVAVLLVAALVLLIWLSSRRRRHRLPPADGLAGATAALQASQFVPVIEDPLTAELPTVPRAQLPREKVAQSIEEFIDEQPAEVASVLRSWLQRGSPPPSDALRTGQPVEALRTGAPSEALTP
jgi:flagellar M-ring protein FliF